MEGKISCQGSQLFHSGVTNQRQSVLGEGSATCTLQCCRYCTLQSVQHGFCLFCQERTECQAVDSNDLFVEHTSQDAHTQHLSLASNVEVRTIPNSSFDSSLHHANAQHTCTVGGVHGREELCSSQQVDFGADQGPLGRDEGRGCGDHKSRDGRSLEVIEEGITKEGRSHGVSHQGGDPSHQQYDRGSIVQQGRTFHCGGLRANGRRDDGIWTTWGPNTSDGVGQVSQLHDLGGDHGSGVRHGSLALEESGRMGHTSTSSAGFGATTPDEEQGKQSISQEQDAATSEQHQLGKLREDFRGFRTISEPCNLDHQGGRGEVEGISSMDARTRRNREVQQGQDPGIHRCPGRECPAEASHHGIGEGEERAEFAAGTQQGSQGDVDGLVRDLPEDLAVRFAKGWEAQRNPFSESWSHLYRHKRPMLMELACFPNSLLSEEVDRRFGKGASMRLSEWNGANLETQEGIALTTKLLRRYRPVHLWISCECSPYCPLQHINQRTEQQIQNLLEKQARARQQYCGAIQVADVARKVGTQVHWELSARCEAWKLPEIVDFLDRHQLEKVSCSGCAVGLRTTDKQKLLCKAWTIATRNKMMIRHMNLQCQKNHPKGKCEAGQTAHTARYTPSFVRRVVDCFGEHESWAQVVQELQQTRVEQGLAADDIVDVDEEPEEITEAEKKEIEAKIQHIHRATGHGSMKNLIASLQRRGSSAKVIQVARNWKCPTCAERKHQDPRRFATLNTIATKWEVIEIDTATWVHPLTKKRYYFVLFVDSGSRFKVGKILHSPSARAASWETLKQAFEELWLPIFGKPKGIRVDPAGSWLNNEAETYFSNNNILYDPIPAEAHWQISAVEQGIKTIKGVMEALAQDFAELEVSEIFGRSIWVCNNQEIYKGFSPLQHALGRAPDDHQRLFECDDVKPIHPDILADGGFKEDAKIRCQAEKAFAEEQAKRRLERAARMGHRRSQVYIPGDLVYYWRRQLQPADRTSFQTGKFLGPARVIATETRREEDGTLRPGSVVWLHRGGRLIRSAPEQLRKASPYEQQIEELQGPIELPWTITSLATDPKRRTYVDISGDLPDEHEWETDLAFPPEEPGKELAVPTKRFREKGSPAMTDTSQKSRRQNLPQGTKRTVEIEHVGSEASASSSHRPSKESKTDDDAFFMTEISRKAYEIDLHLPESKRGWNKFKADPEAYMASQLKRRQVEVREKTLTRDEALQFHKAKGTEVRNFIAAQCFKHLSDHVPAEDDILGMRWLLTWKYDPKYESGKKAKARAVVLGYQDPEYATRKTSAPTPSKAGRQLFLQYCAYRRFQLSKGDVSGAFLQGMDIREQLWCRPLPEMCEELGIEDGTPMLLTKAAYGLVQAPLYWYESVCNTLENLGYHRLTTEPCCWIFRDDSGTIRSMIHAHVDDFVFAGDKACTIHQQLMQQLQTKYKWGTWEYDSFEQCGILIRQDEDGNIYLSQKRFIEELEEIPMSRDRARQQELPTTDKEKSSLRGLLGSLSWLCGQTCFMYSVDVNFLITTVPVSTVGDILKANTLVRNIKKWKQQEFRIHSFNPNDKLHMVCWTDAAWANRPNGKDSTEGVFIGITNDQLLSGKEADVSPIYWRSAKIDRTCRSPACAETIASLDGEDDMLYLRVLWFEICGGILDPRYPNKAARETTGILVTDSRNLYDKMQRATVCIKGAEKRSDIEAISLRENAEDSGIHFCWVHGGAMIANALTKTTEKAQALLYIQMGFRYKIVVDEQGRSEKVRRKAGIKPMEDTGSIVREPRTQNTH